MCGIFGFSLNRELTDNDIQLAKDCIRSLHHRGPDGNGIWCDREKGILLGHTRLSIIDLSDDNSQPMIREPYSFVYNGELYNYIELKEELQRQGEAFTTTGDTEVFLKSFVRWGKAALDRFDGMFAFALYDGETIHLGTDPFGEKPLYIMRTEEGIYFSSEITPFAKNFALEKYLSKADVEIFIGLGFLPEPSTGFKNIEKVGPASYLTIRNNKLSKQKYWLPYEKNGGGEKSEITNSDIDEFHHELIKSVASRTLADVPVGVFLSSGVDSLLVASIIKKELQQDLLALTVKFRGGEVADESEAAQKAAEFLDLNHLIIKGNLSEKTGDVADVLSLHGELNDNLTILASYAMAMEGSKHVKVAITGTGGDELFYGYRKYLTQYRIDRLMNRSHRYRKAYRFLFENVVPNRLQKQKYLLDLKMLGVGTETPHLTYLCSKNTLGFGYLSGLEKLVAFLENKITNNGRCALAIGRMFDTCQTLPYSYIPNMEKGSMRASLEVRTPFLNRKLFELTQRFHAHAFMRHGNKWVSRKILGRYLPKHLFDYPKRGFIQPRNEFLNNMISRADLKRLLIQNNIEAKVLDSNINNWIDLKLRVAMLDYFLNGEPEIKRIGIETTPEAVMA